MARERLAVTAPSLDLLGMRVDRLSPVQAVDRIVQAAAGGRGGYCCITNVHQCILTNDDPAFRAIVNDADLVLSDSTILACALALRYRLGALPVRRGAELMKDLCAAAEREGIRIALIGGRDEAGMMRLKDRLRAAFPRLDVAFAHSPPFRPPSAAETAGLAASLRRSGAQLILVGLGCPKQERWMAQFKPLVSAMMVGLGAAFDFNAGTVRPSPAWVHRAGLEWLYRLAREPRRLWRRYLTTSPRFVALLILDALRPKAGAR